MKKRIQMDVDEKGLEELKQLMDGLGKATYADTLRASVKITKFLEEAKEKNELILRDKETKKEKERGSNNSNFRNASEVVKCPTCGKEFISLKCKPKKFCSNKCVARINLVNKGRRFEWKARDKLREEGYFVIRSAGSKTPIDLVAWNKEKLRMVQVKSTNSKYASIVLKGKVLDKFRSVEVPTNATKELWIWQTVAGGGWKVIIVDDLVQTKEEDNGKTVKDSKSPKSNGWDRRNMRCP